VIAQLLPEFTKLHPDIEVRIQQLPWTAAHQKLLTAFAGEATPDLCQLGNTWIPEFVALKALEPLDQSLARLDGRTGERLFSRDLGHQHHRRHPLRSAMVHRHATAVLSTRPARAGGLYRAAPGPGRNGSRMLAAIKALVGPERLRRAAALE